ncbi:PECT1 [Symbiodinium microadriaticum]|nr:PECT1 [Symbiodinium microadriaticum]
MAARVLPGGLVLIVPFGRLDVKEEDVKKAFLSLVAQLCAWIKVRMVIQVDAKYAAWMEAEPALKDSLH